MTRVLIPSPDKQRFLPLHRLERISQNTRNIGYESDGTPKLEVRTDLETVHFFHHGFSEYEVTGVEVIARLRKIDPALRFLKLHFGGFRTDWLEVSSIREVLENGEGTSRIYYGYSSTGTPYYNVKHTPAEMAAKINRLLAKGDAATLEEICEACGCSDDEKKEADTDTDDTA